MMLLSGHLIFQSALYDIVQYMEHLYSSNMIKKHIYIYIYIHTYCQLTDNYHNMRMYNYLCYYICSVYHCLYITSIFNYTKFILQIVFITGVIRRNTTFIFHFCAHFLCSMWHCTFIIGIFIYITLLSIIFIYTRIL